MVDSDGFDQIKKKQAAQLLRETASFLNAKTWIQGAMAKNSGGFHVSPMNSGAIGFCATGAVYRTVLSSKKFPFDVADCAVSACVEEIAKTNKDVWPFDYRQSLESWNDDLGRTVKQVCQLFRLTASHLNGRLYYGK